MMELGANAWSILGSAFGPAIVLALFWRRFNYKGACAGIITGFVVSLFWLYGFNKGSASFIFNTGLYELIPGAIISLAVAVIVSLCTKAPSQEVVELFNSVGKTVDEE